MTPALKAESATYRAGGKVLVDGVSPAVDAGERVALVGPNGAGKTTLLRMLSGELKPDGGKVELKGKNISSYSSRELGHRAVLSQSVSVAFPFTVSEIVAMGAPDIHGSRLRDLVRTALAEVDLVHFADRLITTLSGGEQQRAHFARILVQLTVGEQWHGPGILLLDEPTASLDLRHQLDLLSATSKNAGRGIAVVAVLHDLNLAALFADRVVVLQNGRIAAQGRPSDTINDDILRQVFGIENAANRLPPSGVPFVLPHAAVSRS
jgi:iron complex transport system ATP-binding protein